VDKTEDWEDELYESVAPAAATKVRDWKTLREQIQHNLKKKHKDLPLSQINQLMILSSFATLHLKGATQTAASLDIAQQWYCGTDSGSWFARRIRALARHYQIFEQLPMEKQGGMGNRQSLFQNESVQEHTQRWLSNLKTVLRILVFHIQNFIS
jgi:hypothetical protein